MTDKVSTLNTVELRGSEYIFLHVSKDDQHTDLQRILIKYIDSFGSKVGGAARAVLPTENTSKIHFDQVSEKNWQEPIEDLMQKNDAPFLLIFNKNFDEFDPRNDNWRIVWFLTAKDPRKSIPEFFGVFRETIKDKGDIFEYLDDVVNDATGASYYGSISSPTRLDPTLKKRGKGHPGILAPEFGVKAWIEEKVESRSFTDFSHGWKTRLAEQLMAEIPDIATVVGTAKGTADALRRAGIFEKIVQSSNKK